MKKKGLLVLSVTVLILVSVGILLLPKRIKLYNAVNDNIESLGAKGEMFDSYDVVDDSLEQIETEHLIVGVPKGSVSEKNDIIDSYKLADESVYVGISKNVSDERIAFFVPGCGETSQIFDIEYSFDDLREGFEKLGYGMPNSTYNTYKCMYLLKEEDYSFWDYEKGLAYANVAYVKNEDMWMDVHYVYEREDMYATIMERNLGEDGLHFFVSVFDPGDLNTSYMVVIRVNDRQQGYAIINSIKLK